MEALKLYSSSVANIIKKIADRGLSEVDKYLYRSKVPSDILTLTN
jgi:Mn-dependent DtxR family transcriptional regulator